MRSKQKRCAVLRTNGCINQEQKRRKLTNIASSAKRDVGSPDHYDSGSVDDDSVPLDETSKQIEETPQRLKGDKRKIITKIGKERMPRALWSNAVWCKLIKEFKARPALWCHQHPLYGDAVSTSALIHDVAEVLTKEYRSTYTDDDVSEHWNTLKSGLLQYLTKLNCWAKNFTRSSMAPSFKYARHLEFLMEDEGIISFSDTIQAMHQCDVCGSYFSSWRSLNAHKTVQCPADDCEWEGDNFAEHLHQAHPDMSLASLLKRLGSSGSLRCILLSQQKRLAESTSGSATSSLMDGSLNATGGAVIEKCDDVHQLASTSSNTYSMSSSCPVTHPSKRLFSCPVTDCFFRSTDFSRYNAHLVAEHPDVFKMGTSIESRESLNDGAIGDDYFVSVDAEDYEGGDEDDRPKNDDEGILHCERISANVSLVEPVKADSLMDEVECYGSKDVLLTEQRLVLEAEEGSRVEIMREIPVFESVLSKANEDMIDDAYLPLSASLVDVPEGVCFIKTENHIEQHKKMKIECGTPHSVTPLLSVHLDENPLWNDRDVSATSTLVSQSANIEVGVESWPVDGEAIAAEKLMEDSCRSNASALIDMRTEMPSTEVAVSLAVHDERIADSPADTDIGEMLEEDGNLALNDRRLDILVHDQRKVALWMKHHRLIASSPRCSVCSMLLKWVIQRNCADYFAWKCINIECEQFKMLHFIRSNSIFDDMRLSLGSYIEAMRLWSAGIVIRRAAKRSGIPNASLTSAYRRFRDVCVNYIERNSLQLGGVKSDCQAHIIQIITKFHIKQSWEAFKFHVLIIVDLNSEPQVFHLEAIEDLSPESIMLVIRKIVMRGTRISCDQSVPIQALIEHNAQTHRALMLESDGVASEEFHFCGAEFTNIGKVNAMKSLLWKLRCGLLASYRLCGLASCEGAAAEYLWRYRFSDNPFANLCQHITKYCSF